MNNFEDIKVSVSEFIATITIHRAPNNFFDFSLIGQIAEAFNELDKSDECRVIVLCSEGKHFCAGANFSGDRELVDGIDPIDKLYKEAVKLFRNKKPIIAAVQGGAIGGGLGVSLVADFRIASPESRFSSNFSQLGFHQGFGTTVTLPRVVGNQNASMMLLTGKRLKGEEALEIGLADFLVPQAELMNKAYELASEIASAGPLAVEAIRSTIRQGLADDVEKIISWELAEQKRLQSTSDFKEGIAASTERRKPIFTRS
tara:strand:+ start:11367 stop:12140 length:774 start_codon:yes stop_codon:yes gene_type:complete